jgi:hypothetical protein
MITLAIAYFRELWYICAMGCSPLGVLRMELVIPGKIPLLAIRCTPPRKTEWPSDIPAVARRRAIFPAYDPDLGRLLLVGRRLVVSERHPANRVGAWVMVSKAPGASWQL